MGEILEVIKDEFLVIALAAAPISELRGAIPFGIKLGFSPLHSTILSIIGNLLIVPVLLLCLKPIFRFLGKFKIFEGILAWIRKRTIRRSAKVKKYSTLGLFLLVAIPLPTTGAWTGCLAATFFNIDFKSALLAISSGVIAAGIIVFSISYRVTTLL